jgi:hypothetical protein
MLIETLGSTGPSLVGQGSAAKHFVPISRVLRSHESKQAVLDSLSDLASEPRRLERRISNGRRRIVADPLLTSSNHLNGAWLWIGGPEEQPPRRDPAFAWVCNLSRGTVSVNPDLLAPAVTTGPGWEVERALAAAFLPLLTGPDENVVLAKIVNGSPGTEHQTLWSARRDDGTIRAMSIACRISSESQTVRELSRDDATMYGIAHDVGRATDVVNAPLSTTLAERILRSATPAGTYRALVNRSNLTLLRWYGSGPVPGLCWDPTDSGPKPGIHPEDRDVARNLIRQFDATGSSDGKLRLRAQNGSWMTLTLSVATLPLDDHTSAALITITRKRAPDPRCDANHP